MDKKPLLFLYCQHSLGMGHLRRSIEITKTLIDHFEIVFINGGRIPESIPFPDCIESIDLPPLGMNANGMLINQSDLDDLNEAKRVRQEMIQDQFQKCQPDVVLIELFPFGRKKFAFELLPLLRLANKSCHKPLIVCDLRDILVNDRRDQQRHDDRARWLCKRYFDAILVHTDPQFARLEESFQPEKSLSTPVFYTGFVAGNAIKTNIIDPKPGIVVSAGGGNVGQPLFIAAINAQPRIWQQYRIPMSIVAGPFLPDADWQFIQHKAQNVPGLTVYRSVPDLKCLLQNATVSISQCGYNTTMDILTTKVPSLLIPYAEGRENEQTKRAFKLEKLDVARVLPETELSTDRLIEEIAPLLEFKPLPFSLQMNGAKRSSEILLQLLNSQQHPGLEKNNVMLA